jgi:hypothetical protein
MGQRAVASDGRQRAGEDEDSENRDSGREVLRQEAVQRDKRVRIRKEQQLKKDAVKRLAKRRRMFKVAGVWVVLIVALFLVTAWFAPDLMKMLRNLGR